MRGWAAGLLLVGASAQAAPPRLGFWGINGYRSPEGLQDLATRFGIGVFHSATIDPDEALTEILPIARAAHLQVTLRLTGDHGRYTDADGNFDLAAWSALLAPWARPELRTYIEDGTFAGHMLLDDIHNFSGADPTAAQLEEMARQSKELLPGLMTWVREKATAMPLPEGGRYRQVDAIDNQYKAADGDVAAYAFREASWAEALGLQVICGLNIANGGDGRSGRSGWGPGRFAMSGAEITEYGRVFADRPECSMLLLWEYDGLERWTDGSVGSDWFDREPQRLAIVELAERFARRPAALK